MSSDVGHAFYNAARAVGDNHPLLLVIASTPDLELVLGCSKATFIERVPTESVGRLNRFWMRSEIIPTLSSSEERHSRRFWTISGHTIRVWQRSMRHGKVSIHNGQGSKTEG